MLRLFLFLFLVQLFGCQVFIPKKYRFYVSDARWNTIRLAEIGTAPILSDSMVVMYSNRNFHPESKKVLGDYIDSLGVSRIFLASASQGIWYLYPMQTIDEAVRIIGKKRNIVCYVEGMGKNFPIGLERAFSLSAQHGVTVIMMDYPSINMEFSAFKNFNYARQCSHRTAPFLVKMLQEVQLSKQSGADWTTVNWTLFHHSMGNIMLKRIMEERLDSMLSPLIFDQLVLNAPCVEEKDHKLWLVRNRLAKKTFVHYNKDDRQLNGANLLTGKTPLGTKPEIPLAENAVYVDFNPLVGDVHSTFIDIPMRPTINPRARQYYSALFNGIPLDFADSTLFGKGWKGIGVFLK